MMIDGVVVVAFLALLLLMFGWLMVSMFSWTTLGFIVVIYLSSVLYRLHKNLGWQEGEHLAELSKGRKRGQ